MMSFQGILILAIVSLLLSLLGHVILAEKLYSKTTTACFPFLYSKCFDRDRNGGCRSSIYSNPIACPYNNISKPCSSRTHSDTSIREIPGSQIVTLNCRENHRRVKVTRITYILPRNKLQLKICDYKFTGNCRTERGSSRSWCKERECCQKHPLDISSCQKAVSIPPDYSWNTDCINNTSSSSCTIVVPRQLVKNCAGYNCSPGKYSHCYARWVNVTYECVTIPTVTDRSDLSSEGTTTSITNITVTTHHHQQLPSFVKYRNLVILLVISISCVVSTVICCILIIVLCRRKGSRRSKRMTKSRRYSNRKSDQPEENTYEQIPAGNTLSYIDILDNEIPLSSQDDVTMTDKCYYDDRDGAPSDGRSQHSNVSSDAMVENSYYDSGMKGRSENGIDSKTCADDKDGTYHYVYGHFRLEGRKRDPTRKITKS